MVCIYLKTDSNLIKWQAVLKSLEKYGYVWNGSKANPLSRASNPNNYITVWIKDKTITCRTSEVSKTEKIIEIVMD